jgi:small subunit ribosomal protein S8
MSLQDPISDMLTRIRNAFTAAKESVDIPHSKMKAEIARLLKREGYILDYSTEADGVKKTLRVFLKYGQDQEPVIRGIRRISKPSLRRYVSSGDIPRVLGGLGVAILSTSTGLLTDREARKQQVGGEVLCYVW